MFQPNQNLYGVAIGSTIGKGTSYPHYDTRAPTILDTNYSAGQEWVWVNNSIWFLLGLSTSNGVVTANWELAVNSTGDIISVTGTPDQITSSTSSGAVTLSTPPTFVGPGSVASTTNIIGGTGVTALTGNITATNGNFVFGTSGNKIITPIASLTTAAGANSFGTVQLVAGTIQVQTTAITVNSIVFFTRLSPTVGSTALGFISLGAISAGSFFTINSTRAASPTTLETGDISVIGWQIIN